MGLPLLAAGGLIGGKVLGGLTDILGGNSAADDLRKAQGRARGDISTGYAGAIGAQNPIYETGLNAYQNLAEQQAGGAFNNPHVDPFKLDPNAIFSDPTYQSQMRSGTMAIDNSAERSGDLFSGKTAMDQQQFGNDLFANRYDALQGQGQAAQNAAVAQNQAANAQNFGQGMSLAQPGFGAANALSDLNVGQGNALASNDLGLGQINAGNTLRTSGAIGGMFNDLGGGLADMLAPGAGVPGMVGSAANGGVNMFDPSYFNTPKAPKLGTLGRGM